MQLHSPRFRFRFRKGIKRFASSVVRVMVCPAAAAAAVQIIQSAVGGTGSGRKPRNRIHTLCGPWKRIVDGKTAGWEALRRSKERRSAKGGRSRRRRCPPSMTSALRPLVAREFSSLSHRLYPDPFSNVSDEYVARCARSWCRSPGLHVRTTLSASSRFMRIFLHLHLVSNAKI